MNSKDRIRQLEERVSELERVWSEQCNAQVPDWHLDTLPLEEAQELDPGYTRPPQRYYVRHEGPRHFNVRDSDRPDSVGTDDRGVIIGPTADRVVRTHTSQEGAYRAARKLNIEDAERDTPHKPPTSPHDAT